MKIQIKDYTLTPSDNVKDRFDLTQKIIRKGKTGVKYEASEIIGYGMTLESCIKSVIALELDKDNSVVSLKEFVEAYKKEREVIMDILK